MSPLEFITLIISAFLSATISGLVGMAGGILLLGTMLFVMPLPVLVPIHGLVQLASNTSRTFILRAYVHRKILFWFTCGVPIGGYLGYRVLSHVVAPDYLLLLIVTLLLYVVFKPKKFPYIHIPLPAFFILGIVATFLSSLIGATGPLLAPFFIRTDLKKEEIVASKAACQFMTHLVKIPIFLNLSFQYGTYKELINLMIIAVIAGSTFGTYLLRKIDGKRFLFLIKGACIIVALRLTFKVLSI